MSESPGAARAESSIKVTALLPLALLESIRQHDRPREMLEDEDLAESLPRRLGLTSVVESQIYRYERARKRGDRIAGEEVQDLLRLVLRRPDAEAILLEAGRLVARRHYDRASAIVAATRRVLPRRLAAAAARRAARQVIRRIAVAGEPDLSGPPLTVRLPRAITVAAEEAETACALVTGLLEELTMLYTGDRTAVRHRQCAGDGHSVCEWAVAG